MNHQDDIVGSSGTAVGTEPTERPSAVPEVQPAEPDLARAVIEDAASEYSLVAPLWEPAADDTDGVPDRADVDVVLDLAPVEEAPAAVADPDVTNADEAQSSEDAASGNTSSEIPPGEATVSDRADDSADAVASDGADVPDGVVESDAPDASDGADDSDGVVEADIPRVGGTILIPAGMSSLPDALRSQPSATPTEAISGPGADGHVVEAPLVSAIDAPLRPSSPSLPPAVIAAAAARASNPPHEPMAAAMALDPGMRKEHVEARKARRHTMILVGSLGAGVVALVAVLVFVVVSRGSAKAGAERKFLAAQQVALTTTAAANGEVVSKMAAVAKAPKVNPAELKDVVAATKTRVSSLSLPRATGTYAPASDRLSAAVAAESAFLNGVGALADRKLVDLTASDATQIDALWKEAVRSLTATYADAKASSPPPWDTWTSSVGEFGKGLTASADRARANAAELAILERYRGQAAALLDRYESLRTQLGNYEARKKYVYASGDVRTVRAVFEAASSSRYELATQLAAVTPPAALAPSHQGMVSIIRRLASEVYSAAGAANEAYCGTDSYYYNGYPCVSIGDTSTYKRYITIANSLSEDFARTKSTWLTTHGQETARLS